MTSATASVAVYTIEPTIEPATDDRHDRPYRCGPSGSFSAAPSHCPRGGRAPEHDHSAGCPLPQNCTDCFRVGAPLTAVAG